METDAVTAYVVLASDTRERWRWKLMNEWTLKTCPASLTYIKVKFDAKRRVQRVNRSLPLKSDLLPYLTPLTPIHAYLENRFRHPHASLR